MMKKIMISLLTACATLSAAPKAIVFDFGGVMTKEPTSFSVTALRSPHKNLKWLTKKREKRSKLAKETKTFGSNMQDRRIFPCQRVGEILLTM